MGGARDGGGGAPTRVARAAAGLTPAMLMVMEAMVSAGRTEASCTGSCVDAMACLQPELSGGRPRRVRETPLAVVW
jgi:hypothetical protein